jgi:hypothetical protein
VNLSPEKLLRRLAESDLGQRLLAETEAEREADHARLVQELRAAEAEFARTMPPALKARDKAIAEQEELREKQLQADQRVFEASTACSAIGDTLTERRLQLEPKLRAAANPDVLAWPAEMTRRLEATAALYRFVAEPTPAGTLREVLNTRPAVDAYQRRIVEARDEFDRLVCLPSTEALQRMNRLRTELDKIEAEIPNA